MQNLKGQCSWVLSAAGVHPQTFCLKPTGFVMARDNDGKSVRVYNTLCAAHVKAYDAQQNEDE